MTQNEDLPLNDTFTDRVLSLAASCIRVATLRILRQSISHSDAVHLARAHNLDVSAAINALRRHLNVGAGATNTQQAIDEAKILTLSAGEGAISAIVRIRQEALKKDSERSTALEKAREGSRSLHSFEAEFKKWSAIYVRFMDQLEAVHRQTRRQLHYLSLSQTEGSTANAELEEILATAIRDAECLIGRVNVPEMSENIEEKSVQNQAAI